MLSGLIVLALAMNTSLRNLAIQKAMVQPARPEEIS
jgi:hypothetical protein